MRQKEEKPSLRGLEMLLVMAIFVIVNLFGYALQNRISHHSGKGWDGVFYFSVAEQFSQGKLPQGDAPFVYRIGTPLLASLIPADNLLDAFWFVNLIANAIAVVLLLVFLRRHLDDWRLRVLLAALFMTQWLGPVRFIRFYPAYVDPFAFVFILAGLIAIDRIRDRVSTARFFALGVLTFAGVLFRETVILIAAAVFFIQDPIDGAIFRWSGVKDKLRGLSIAVFLPLLLGVLALALTRLLATSRNDYSFLRQAVYSAYGKPFLVYVHAWFIAFGPILAIVLYDVRNCWAFLKSNQHLLVVLVGYAALGWIGALETERYLYWTMPVVYLLLGRSIQNNARLLRSLPLVAALTITQAISQRIFWPIPDYPTQFAHKLPLLTPIGSRVPYLDLYAPYGKVVVEAVSLAEYVLVVGVLIFWLHMRSRASLAAEAMSNKSFDTTESLPHPRH